MVCDVFTDVDGSVLVLRCAVRAMRHDVWGERCVMDLCGVSLFVRC